MPARPRSRTSRLAGRRPVAASRRRSSGAHLGRVEETRVAAAEGASLAAKGGNQVFRVLNEWAVGLLELSLGQRRGREPAHERPAGDRRWHGLPQPWRPTGARRRDRGANRRRRSGSRRVDRRSGGARARARQRLGARRRGAMPGPVAGGARRHRGALLELERALVEHESSPQPLERGRTLLAYGSTLRRAKRRREAREALMAALEVFDLLGAPLWAERAAAEIARIPGRTQGSTTYRPRSIASPSSWPKGCPTRRLPRACSCRCARSRRTSRTSTASSDCDRERSSLAATPNARDGQNCVDFHRFPAGRQCPSLVACWPMPHAASARFLIELSPANYGYDEMERMTARSRAACSDLARQNVTGEADSIDLPARRRLVPSPIRGVVSARRRRSSAPRETADRLDLRAAPRLTLARTTSASTIPAPQVPFHGTGRPIYVHARSRRDPRRERPQRLA